MNTQQLLVRLPDDLAARFRLAVPARQRSSFVRDLIEKNLPQSDEAVYQAALIAQQDDDAHPEELQDWLNLPTEGLDAEEEFDETKLKALCQP